MGSMIPKFKGDYKFVFPYKALTGWSVCWEAMPLLCDTNWVFTHNWD